MSNRASEIHAGLKHPVIDGDGHWLEPVPVFLEYLREVSGAQSVDRMRALWQRTHVWYHSTWSQRQHDRTRRSNWWGVTSKTLDKATALLPALLNERLPELGIDFALIYPSLGLAFNGVAQDDLRRAAARAYNKMTVDMFAPYAARFAPVAIIPMHTPEESDRGTRIRRRHAGLPSDHAQGKPGASHPECSGGHRREESRVVRRWRGPRQ